VSDKKPFWSSVPGVVTGVAGVISAIVGLLGVSTQLGWIGGDGNGSSISSSSADAVPTTTASTVVGATTTPTTAAARPGEFSVEPSSITFEPLKPREATVTVKNTGDVPLTMRAPTITGAAAGIFVVADACARSTLALGRSCDIKVTFAPPQPGEFSGRLVVIASNAPRQVEVPVKGSATLLG
jgi:hypothetical protein